MTREAMVATLAIVLCCITYSCSAIVGEKVGTQAESADSRQSDQSGNYADRLRALETIVNQQQETIESLAGQIAQGRKTITRLTRDATPKNGADTTETATGAGVTYVRWGRTSCSGTVAAFGLYAGYAAGTQSGASNGGASTLCLHDEPQWGNYNDASGTINYIYGAEYYFSSTPFSTVNNGGGSLLYNDVPCIVCFAPTQSTVLMIPGRIECPTVGNWTLEYKGYLVSDGNGSYSRSDWICMDEAPETIDGGGADLTSFQFYEATAACGALSCPPYVQGRQIPCAVCTI